MVSRTTKSGRTDARHGVVPSTHRSASQGIRSWAPRSGFAFDKSTLGLRQTPLIVEVTLEVKVVRHERYIDSGLFAQSRRWVEPRMGLFTPVVE